MKRAMHYAGEVRWTNARGITTSIDAGYAACCYGDRARLIRREGRHTHDPALVTCGSCKRVMKLGGVIRGAS